MRTKGNIMTFDITKEDNAAVTNTQQKQEVVVDTERNIIREAETKCYLEKTDDDPTVYSECDRGGLVYYSYGIGFNCAVVFVHLFIWERIVFLLNQQKPCFYFVCRVL